MKHWLRSLPLPFYAPPDAPGGGTPAPVVDEPVVAAVGDAAVPVVPAGGDAPAGDVVPAAKAEPAPADAPAAVDAHAQTSLLESIVADPAKPAEGAAAAPDAVPKAPDAAPAADAVKPAEGEIKAPDAVPADGEKKADAPAAPLVAPLEYKFSVPDGLAIDEASFKPAIEVFQKHNIAPEVANELVGMYIGKMQELQTQTAQDQHRAWSETRKQWREEVLSDPMLGGAGHQTAMQAVARMRDKLVHSNDMPAFNHMLTVTGVGDHPMFLKLLHTASRLLDEPAAPAAVGNPTAHNGTRKTGRLRDTYQS